MNHLLRFLIPCIILSLPLLLSAQCPEGKVILDSDEAVAEFVKNYPDCTEIPGDLIIGTEDGFASTRTQSIAGLERIKKVNGSLLIRGNLWLSSIRPLSHVKSVGGDVILEKNPELSTGFIGSKLTRVDGDMKLMGFKGATNFPYSNLVKVEGDLILGGFSEIRQMFPALWKVGGDLKISGNYNLEEMDDFHSLGEIGGELYIGYNVSLKKVSGFFYLKKAGAIRLENMRLASFELSGSLDSLGSLSLSGVSLDRMPAFFRKLKKLKELSLSGVFPDFLIAFEALEEVDRLNLSISGTQGFPDGGFPNLKKVNKKLGINPFALPALASLKEVGEDVEIYNLPSLALLEPLSNLDTIGRYLNLQNGKFTDFENLPMIRTKTLIIRNNFELKDLTGFDLSNLGLSELQISNAGLTSLDGLQGEPAKKMKINISYNKNLSACQAEALCPYFKNKKLSWELTGNGEGCNLQSLREACSE
jgi:hypothetical protein